MNPFKLYNAQRNAQLRWIHDHPVQYVALNATLLAVWFVAIELKDRAEMRKWEESIETPTESETAAR